jgi:hypothetical protein
MGLGSDPDPNGRITYQVSGNRAPLPSFFASWWRKRVPKEKRKGFNTIIGAWILWKHRNSCVIYGATPTHLNRLVRSVMKYTPSLVLAGARGLKALCQGCSHRIGSVAWCFGGSRLALMCVTCVYLVSQYCYHNLSVRSAEACKKRMISSL